MKKPDRYVYPAVLTYAEGQEIAVTFPDLPGCTTCGETEAKALMRARDALGGHLWCMEQDDDPILDPTPLLEVKCEEGERAVLVETYMPTIRLAQESRAVNRTVTLPAWLNALAVERGVNFSQTLQTAIIQQLNLDN